MGTSAADRYRGCLLGLACGDAVGTTVEFKQRGGFAPVTDMTGGGPFGLEPGQWTDDTSMALCLARSLVESGGFDARDQMERYCRWWKEGYLSCTGSCFDVGNTVASALARFLATGEPLRGSTDPMSAGNGSLMRLAPVAMYYAPDRSAAVHLCGESSRTTHGCDEAVDACRYFGGLLLLALEGAGKRDLVADTGDWMDDPPLSPAIRAVARGTYRTKPGEEIRGDGYVVNSLEAALWSFWSTQTFEEAILAAVNLGDDADTTGAICGQIAGAFYGAGAIPDRWTRRLAMRDRIATTADALRDARSTS